ncbi:MAG: hypothetical protein JWO63_1321 [Frankiales bacterium]|nr:hypothetical protein [Frankiales bacterium]
MGDYGLSQGILNLKSIGAITFGPDGILFLADNVDAAVYALDVADSAPPADAPIDVERLDARLASYVGVDPAHLSIRGMAVHPVSAAVYLSVMRGHGAAASPVLVRVLAGGAVEGVDLLEGRFSRLRLGDAPRADDERQDVLLNDTSDAAADYEINGVHLKISRIGLRASTITDLAFLDGTLLVAGASNEEFASTLRRIPFPFTDKAQSTALEIFHVSHGKYETASPIRTFVPFNEGASVLASYTCTPVVQFSIADLLPGAKASGRTVAELGAMNQPLDMISYRQDGAEYLLVSNSRHPLLKIPTSAIADQPPLTEPTEPVGVPRQELAHVGVSWMANLGPARVLMMQRDETGELALHSNATYTL